VIRGLDKSEAVTRGLDRSGLGGEIFEEDEIVV
jgi:hypothetical protein